MNARTFDDFGEPGVASLRVPPHSPEAESAVLGALLLDPLAWDRIGDLLSAADFYRLEHQLTFGAISSLALASRPVDVVTVFEVLQAAGNEQRVGGMAYLHKLSQYIPSAANLRSYADIVRERAVLRRLISASDEIATMAFNPQGAGAADVLDKATGVLNSLLTVSATDDWEASEQGVAALMDQISAQADGEAQPNYVATGLDELDELLNGGLREGHLVVVGGRPSMGKTALALSIGRAFAKAGHPVGMLSMEMPRAEVRERRMSMETQIHLSRIQRGERLRDYDWPSLTHGADELRAQPFYTSDQNALNINQVRAKARALKRRHGLRLLIVDYLGLMAGTDHRTPRAYQLEEITKGLKALAKELGITVLLLAQLGREVEKRPDQRPLLSDFRDSGSVEQDADVCMFVYRECKAKPGLPKEWDYLAELIVGKQRNGPPGKVEVMYVGENTLFKNWPEGQEKPESRVRVKGGDL